MTCAGGGLARGSATAPALCSITHGTGICKLDKLGPVFPTDPTPDAGPELSNRNPSPKPGGGPAERDPVGASAELGHQASHAREPGGRGQGFESPPPIFVYPLGAP